jgi:hypothetical protein
VRAKIPYDTGEMVVTMRVTRPDNERSLSKRRHDEVRLAMPLEAVWQILENGKWESKQALREASGVDDDTLSRIINFLNRWNFVDIQRSPELLVRRRPEAISPVETFDLLRAITDSSSIPTTRPRLAERVACRVCNGRDLKFVGINEVECTGCHEKQWYAIEPREALTDHETAQSPTRLGLLERVLVRLGFPQPAFHVNNPKPVQYFWFRCMSCGKVSSDYPHGFSRYLSCKFCECRTHF